MKLFKHVFVLAAFFVAGRVLMERVQQPGLTLQERLFWVVLLISFILYAVFLLEPLDRARIVYNLI